MQGRGNSGILQVKQCPVSQITDSLWLLSANTQCIALGEQRNPTQGLGAGLGRTYSQKSGHASGKSHILLLNSEADSLHDPCRQTTSLC